MFTRSELEIKTIKELRDLCLRYGIKPTGNKGYKTSWITSLMVFPRMALSQFEADKGLKPPTFAFMQALSNAIDEMNAPTDEQAALIKITMEGKIMNYPDRYTQEKLLALHKAKMYLEMAIGLLSTSHRKKGSEIEEDILCRVAQKKSDMLSPYLKYPGSNDW